MLFVNKDPDAELDYAVDWADPTEGPWLEDGETITTSDWDVPTGLVQPAGKPATNTPTKATVWLAGGTLGARYHVRNRITTSLGRTDDRTIVVSIVQR